MGYYDEEEDPAVRSALQRMASYQSNPRDQQLGERWRDQESATLDRMEGGDDYDLGKLARDILPGIIGGIADGVSNKGRGIGDIVGATLANSQQNAARDTARAQQDREYALKQRAQREASSGGSDFDRAYKQLQASSERDRIRLAGTNTGLREKNTDQGERRTKIAEDTHSFGYNPLDPRAVKLTNNLVESGADPSIRELNAEALKLRGHATNKEVDHAMAGIEADDKAAEATKVTDANTRTKINAEADLAPTSAATAAAISGAQSDASTAARISTENELADKSAETKRMEAGATTEGRLDAEGDIQSEKWLDPVGRNVVDPERVARIKRDPKLAAKVQEQLAASGNLIETISEMASIRDQEAQGLVTPGRAQSRMLTERAQLESQFAKANDMATIQEGDRLAMAKFLGLPANASVLDIASILGGTDFKLEQLKGVRDALVSSDQRMVRETGFGAYGTGKVQPMAAPAPRPSARRAPAQPSAAPAPDAAPAGAQSGMMTIRLGGEERQVPADQARRLKAMNPALEVY